MSTEEWVAKLESESAAMKQGFARPATSIDVLSRTVLYSTVKNAITFTYTGGSTQVVNDPERFIVTYTTLTGANTLAKLEISTDQTSPSLKVRRIPYSGGARWSVVMNSRDYATWATTNCVITIQALLDGNITINEVTS